MLYIGIAAMGLNLLTGYNGQVSIGHGAFFGIGAYTSAILMHSHGWQFLPTLLVAAPLCFFVGVLIGFPALRLKGLYLALVTLGLAVVFPQLVNRYVPHDLCQTCGTNLVSLNRVELARPHGYRPRCQRSVATTSGRTTSASAPLSCSCSPRFFSSAVDSVGR